MRVVTLGPEALAQLENASVYDDLATLAAAEHAVAVYAQPADYELELLRAGWSGGNVIERGAAQCGLAWSPQAVMVTPRGSSERLDWLANAFSVWRRGFQPYAEGRIGAGFRSQALAVGPVVIEFLEELHRIGIRPPIYVQGHSLGGAAATPLVAYLDHHGYAVRCCWRISAPRCGNRTWRDWYDRRYTAGMTPTWHVVHVRRGVPDLVTRVPRRRWGFRHEGRRVLVVPTPDGVELDRGEAAWQERRGSHPVDHLAAWRILSRLVAGVAAHVGPALLRSLRARVAGLPAEATDQGHHATG